MNPTSGQEGRPFLCPPASGEFLPAPSSSEHPPSRAPHPSTLGLFSTDFLEPGYEVLSSATLSYFVSVSKGGKQENGLFPIAFVSLEAPTLAPGALHGSLCCCLVAKLCLTLWDPMDCSPPGSSIHRFSQARILEWVAIPICRRSSQPKDRTPVSCGYYQGVPVKLKEKTPESGLGGPVSHAFWRHYT